MQHTVRVELAFDLANVELRGFFQDPAPFVLVKITQQEASASFGFGQLRLNAKPAFLVRARSFFDDSKQRTDNALRLWMMPLEFIACKFLPAAVFQSLVRLFVGDDSVKQFDSFKSQVFHGIYLSSSKLVARISDVQTGGLSVRVDTGRQSPSIVFNCVGNSTPQQYTHP